MKELSTVKYEVVGGVATISLNRPSAMNAFNTVMRKDLYAAVNEASGDESVRVVIIAAQGKGFCSGADLSEEIADEDGFITEQLRNEYMPMLAAIAESPKPFIASINGAAAGIGAALALSCDLMVMAEDAFIYSAFGAISLVPDGGFHWHLARQIGSKKAYEIILESQRLPAKQCLELGLANKVFWPDDLKECTLAWAENLAKAAPLTACYSKEILAKVSQQTLIESMDLEAQIQNTCIRSQDFKEGTEAFFARRKPKFKGE